LNSPGTQSALPLRLRVFAGPNGSGKSTVIRAIKERKENNKLLDLGVYVNADDIASALREGTFGFSDYELVCSKDEIISFASDSGLLAGGLNLQNLDNCFQIENNSILIIERWDLERLAQIIARFLREALLTARRRFSFETVFSHPSNLDIMRRAAEAGYKVYFYFVSTESPEINKYRVAVRVKQNGHAVPEDKIESRYYRSMDLMKEASEIAYQAFFFDNSLDNEPFKLIAHFKRVGDTEKWDDIASQDISEWFKKYYR
jgi:predicted ABC-type ATPase